jgi:D-alanine--poly(phosphoribitol) ligase subunit 1
VDRLHASEAAAEAHRALNRTAAPYPAEGGIPGLFARRAAEFPDRPAVIHGGRSLDYRTLDRLAGALAARLAGAGVAPGQVVGVCVERSPELVAGLLAVLRCGAAYLPFSAAWPDARLRELCALAGCATVLTDRPAGLGARLPGVTVVEAAVMEAATVAGAGAAPGPPPPRVGPGAIAYINFTSGSHGRPKGVLVEHRAVLRLVCGAVYTRLDETTRLLHMAPVTFDAATFEIWGALLNGGTCVLHPAGFVRFSELKRVLDEHAVTTVFLTTALFNSLVDEAPQTLDKVDRILTGGEAHSLRHIGRALALYGPDRVTSVYGPTECTTFATYHPVRELPPGGAALPIGLPIQNTRAYVVDGDRLCAPGESGEVLLAGPGLSPGYLGMPGTTAERFVVRTIDGVPERLYRTGDLAHLGPAGLVFEGRCDDQVKISGFRVEPGEVAHHLGAHPEVRQGYVAAHDGPGGQKVLTAFVVPASERCTRESVRAFLAARLPGYMVPAGVRLCRALPLTPTGKVDRRALLSSDPSDLPDPLSGGSSAVTLSKRARQFQRIADERGLDLVVRELPDSTRTADEAARALGCAKAQIVKSLVFREERTGRPVVVLASGVNRVDEAVLAERLGGPVAKADAGYVKERTGFAIGGVPPFGHREPVELFVDEDLLAFDEVWAAAGTPHAVVRIGGRITDVLGEHTVLAVT